VQALASTIERRFDGARLTQDTGQVSVDLTFEGCSFRARAAMTPVGRVAVQVPATDGFELQLAWTDRTGGTLRPPSFDDSFLVETNDVALANMWLDREVRDWLLASRYVSKRAPERETALLVRDGTWQHEVRGDQVTVERDDAEPSADRIADMLTAALALAARPVRWARTFAPLAYSVGGELASRVELGGRPVVRVRRGASEVHVRLLRRLGPADPGRLRTVVAAHRHLSSGETLSLIAEGLPRAAWPPLAEVKNPLRIDSRARTLLDAAHPSTTIVRPHDVEITFDGALADPQRVGAAVELAAYWAGDRSNSPYR
jgi:hypothetical protein